MNEHHDDDDARIRRAIRSALGDIVSTTPPSAAPRLQPIDPQPSRPRRPMITLAAGLTAAAGIVGVVLIANRADDEPSSADQPDAPYETPAPTQPATSSTTGSTTSTPATSTTSATTPAAAAGGPGSTVASSQLCGSASVPPDAANVQTISGDIDGDRVDDTVTLYSLNDAWHVQVTSSEKSKSSDAVVDIDVDDTMTISFEDIDYSLGADVPPPRAIMAMGQGENDEGIIGNFTFLTLNTDYCVAQWIYLNQRGVDEPFQWVALQEPGHVTGMICETAAGSRYYRLVDSEQNEDGSWRVINRLLTHNFTRAEIEFPPEETVADSPEFVNELGNIQGCDHPPLRAP